MVQLVQNKPLETREPSIAIDAGLALGRHRFQLEVVDSAGLRSKADIAVVTVQRVVIGPVITPVITPVRPPVGPPVVTPIVAPIVAPGSVRPTDGRIDLVPRPGRNPRRPS